MGRAATLRLPSGVTPSVSALVDTSILIDYLRGHAAARTLLERERATGVLHASEITRLEVLAGMRETEEDATRALLSTLAWHPVDVEIAETAGALGRRWLPSHRSIDSADLAIAATAIRAGTELLTRNLTSSPPLRMGIPSGRLMPRLPGLTLHRGRYFRLSLHVL